MQRLDRPVPYLVHHTIHFATLIKCGKNGSSWEGRDATRSGRRQQSNVLAHSVRGEELASASGRIPAYKLDELRGGACPARGVIEEAERVHLPERDSLRVLDLPEHPPAPNARLLKAAGKL